LKRFSAANKRFFDQETQAYSKLPNHFGITQFFGAFVHVDIPTRERTFNILLEYGESEPEEYFRNSKPPQLLEELHALWKSLLEAADALRSIHHGPKDNECDANIPGYVTLLPKFTKMLQIFATWRPLPALTLVKLAPGYQAKQHPYC